MSEQQTPVRALAQPRDVLGETESAGCVRSPPSLLPPETVPLVQEFGEEETHRMAHEHHWSNGQMRMRGAHELDGGEVDVLGPEGRAVPERHSRCEACIACVRCQLCAVRQRRRLADGPAAHP